MLSYLYNLDHLSINLRADCQRPLRVSLVANRPSHHALYSLYNIISIVLYRDSWSYNDVLCVVRFLLVF